MADPLRRTLLAKLRGKKSKKGTSVGGGYGCAAAEANGRREGKEKVLQAQLDSDGTHPVLLSRLGCTTERMSTYENCVDRTVVQAGGVIIVRDGRAAELVRLDEQLLGVSGQRDGHCRGHAHRGADRSSQGPESADRVGASHVRGKRFVSLPRQCSVGDSIGFGDNTNRVLYRTRAEDHTGNGKAPECGVTAADSDGTEPRDRGLSRPTGTVVALHQHNANWTFDTNPTLEAHAQSFTAVVYPRRASGNVEETVLIRNIESYEPEYAGDVRGTAGGLQSPTFFPTELEICDNAVASLCAAEESLRYPLDSEDEDYYDNEILPFYETIRMQGDGDRAETEVTPPGQDKEQLDGSNSAQETDRLRNQLKEAYYLLINAMNDISLDVQQVDGGLAEQQATSSCSSHSRDSLCSRLSAKNMDSDSWSSGGDHSPQQVSDTDSLLLCLSGNVDSGPKSRLNSRSMVNLSVTKIRPLLIRSASDTAFRYPDGPSVCAQAPEEQSLDICDDTEAPDTTEAGAAAVRAELSDHNAISREELQQVAGGKEDSGSVNSLTGSTDSGADAPTAQGRDNKSDPTGVRGHRANSVNKGHGVTVNKMQEWMHKGRLLSSEMKQRIEGSSLPRGGGKNQDQSCSQASPGGSKATAQTACRGGKSVKAKSPIIKTTQQQPGRKATQRPQLLWIL